MPICPRTMLAMAAVAMGASAAHAQTVAMYGEFHESNGIIGNIPQNPPVVGCVPPPLLAAPPSHLTIPGGRSVQHLALRPTGVDDARCHAREAHYVFDAVAVRVFDKPRVGARGARNIDNPAGGLAVGDPFTIPPFAFQQQLGPQVGVVLNSILRQVDTTFIAAMPGIDRNGPNPGPLPAGSYTIRTANQLAPAPALTRMFSPMNWQNPGNGWDNGLPPGDASGRVAANQTVTQTVMGPVNDAERVRLRYAAGPRQFGGTMAMLLDGKGRRYVVPLASAIPPALRPVAATSPIAPGDQAPGFRRRAGIGWNLTIPATQPPGRIKAFQGNNLTPLGLKPIVAPPCTSTDPLNLLPIGCNLINGFDSYMGGIAPLPPGGTLGLNPKATSVKHVFGFTTGTVSIVVVGQRNATQFSATLTGMGYDTVGVSTLGGPQRNVGLVAGSYTARRTGIGTYGETVQFTPNLLGINLKFTPEPGATGALVSGLGALAVLGHRRRSRTPGSTSRSRGRPVRSS